MHILPREGGLILTGAGKGDAAAASKWTTAKPDAAPPRVADGAPDPVKSAHEEGAEVDLDRLQPATRMALLELAAAVADAFEGPPA